MNQQATARLDYPSHGGEREGPGAWVNERPTAPDQALLRGTTALRLTADHLHPHPKSAPPSAPPPATSNPAAPSLKPQTSPLPTHPSPHFNLILTRFLDDALPIGTIAQETKLSIREVLDIVHSPQARRVIEELTAAESLREPYLRAVARSRALHTLTTITDPEVGGDLKFLETQRRAATALLRDTSKGATADGSASAVRRPTITPKPQRLSHSSQPAAPNQGVRATCSRGEGGLRQCLDAVEVTLVSNPLPGRLACPSSSVSIPIEPSVTPPPCAKLSELAASPKALGDSGAPSTASGTIGQIEFAESQRDCCPGP